MAQDTLTIRHASWIVKFHLIFGSLMTILGFAELVSGGLQEWKWSLFMGFVLGLSFLLLGIWESRNPYITVSKDTLTVHRILLQNKVVPLSDLTRVTSYAGDVRLFCDDAKTTLDRSKIATADHHTLMAFLQQLLPEVSFSI